LAVAALARTAYVANLGGNTVTPIHTATNVAGPAITVGRHPVFLAITR
jgi:YVTN family beta-propeller protein